MSNFIQKLLEQYEVDGKVINFLDYKKRSGETPKAITPTKKFMTDRERVKRSQTPEAVERIRRQVLKPGSLPSGGRGLLQGPGEDYTGKGKKKAPKALYTFGEIKEDSDHMDITVAGRGIMEVDYAYGAHYTWDMESDWNFTWLDLDEDMDDASLEKVVDLWEDMGDEIRRLTVKDKTLEGVPYTIYIHYDESGFDYWLKSDTRLPIYWSIQFDIGGDEDKTISTQSIKEIDNKHIGRGRFLRKFFNTAQKYEEKINEVWPDLGLELEED